MTIYQLTIERLGIHGEGIARLNGFTIFVDGALPGEIIKAQMYEERKHYGRARLTEIITSSPHRTTAPCSYFEKCGGCQLMHLKYAEQLKAKQQRVTDSLQRIGKLKGIEALPCIPSTSPLGYRNKIQLPIIPGDPVRLGLYARNSHNLVEIDSCMIHCPLGDQIFQKVQIILKKSTSPIKHLLIKTAVNTGEALVILVTEDKTPLHQIANQMMNEIPEVKGVIQNINPKQGNTILGKEFCTLAGNDCIEENLCGLKFKVSPASFFQVNPAQAESLYQKVIDFADLRGDETVLDAYCGVGTLSLILAQKAKEVIGVECVADAITDACENAKRNKITNATFICAKAENMIKKLKKIHVAVINPPRKGCESLFLESLADLCPKKLVYVSCDPATLARDLALLCARGYQVETVQPFDMFPQTAHVETVVKLIKKD